MSPVELQFRVTVIEKTDFSNHVKMREDDEARAAMDDTQSCFYSFMRTLTGKMHSSSPNTKYETSVCHMCNTHFYLCEDIIPPYLRLAK